MADKANKPDLTWRIVGGVIALATGFVARKVIEFGWQKATGRKPPADPDSLEISMGEAIGYAIVMGVGMEVARIVMTRTAAKKWQAWKALPPSEPAKAPEKVKGAAS
jgi:hypothetical protein